ncbi:HNH endonuclease [Natrinema marinum]|uniref:HNH endonuclease n=1 Tax=Natrinema marinum TaxID=2961598 RepID=UPI0020C8F33E|nr:HNH endonuclease signature motif containing protein [Natrinema marinum]
MFERPFDIGATYIWVIILVLSVAGILYVVWGFNAAKKESGLNTAVSWLFTEIKLDGEIQSSSADSATTTEKTPPTPERLKNDLRLDRADGQCEYCDEEIDLLEVHHIQPRSEGGPNTRKNLIVLCPNCHRKADRGVYSRSELKHKVKQQEALQEV